jgi:hypothetical protein
MCAAVGERLRASLAVRRRNVFYLAEAQPAQRRFAHIAVRAADNANIREEEIKEQISDLFDTKRH